MALPPEIEFGAHRLKLMTVSRNAEDVLEARRCSDHALTAFCFVGELQDAPGSTSIAWYYSPLYQFERKKIRVDESVIADAFTKAVAQRSDADATDHGGRTVFVDAISVCSSPTAPSVDGSVEDGEVGSERRRRPHQTALPVLFIRLGKSTTFRQYRLVTPDVHDAKSGSDTAEEAETVSEGGAERQPHITPPQLSPMLPRKPSLKLFSARFGSFVLRRPPSMREGLNSVAAVTAAGSAPTTSTEAAAVAVPLMSSPCTVLSTVVGDAGTDMDEDTASISSVATAPAGSRSPRVSSNVLSVLHAADAPLCSTPNSRSRKGALMGRAGSSLSSAFLSTSNIPSGRVSRLPTSAVGTGRSPLPESDVRHSPHNGGVGGSARCSGDMPLFLREPLFFASASSTPDAQSPFAPAPPSTQRLRTPRRPPLLSRSGRALSDDGRQSSSAMEHQGGQDEARATTPPVMHVS